MSHKLVKKLSKGIQHVQKSKPLPIEYFRNLTLVKPRKPFEYDSAMPRTTAF